MSPKSLLRHKLAVSSLSDLTDKAFLPVIDEIDPLDPAQVSRVVLCAGKVYYDLLETRRQDRLQHVAIIRIEQLYPFPRQQFVDAINRYPHATEIVWCQEEPKNQGAWYQSKHHFNDALDHRIPIDYAGRVASAAPAVGNYKTHLHEQKQVVQTALYGSNQGTQHEL
jgi:2-oxoglutarate dehydrogenase E1 component